MGNQPCPKPEGIGDSLWDKVQLCWELDPKKRPLIADFYLPLKGRPIPAKCGAGPYPWDGAIVSRIGPRPNQEPPMERYATASIQPAIPRSPATILRAPTLFEGENRLKPRGIKYVPQAPISRFH
ncbi:hypothetical protein FA13DRAFT_1735009 [Coprinellus micaceus]|uniref:Uncharacterized protein n=1 Tax=Coprinellus micaceus TaxID=71717 RepID=A0A4Y7T5T4_COPMI|nr:hypothetical protein FA13DRAFT_1735009 [Coprinellus micaceus]